MIPRVRPWEVKLVDGRIYHVLAPTKLLAKLVLRDPAQSGTWGAIKSIAPLRRNAAFTVPQQVKRVK